MSRKSMTDNAASSTRMPVDRIELITPADRRYRASVEPPPTGRRAIRCAAAGRATVFAMPKTEPTTPTYE